MQLCDKGLDKKEYRKLEVLWEYYILNGKVNPVSAIFWGRTTLITQTAKKSLSHLEHPSATLPTKSSLRSGSLGLWWRRSSDYERGRRL